MYSFELYHISGVTNKIDFLDCLNLAIIIIFNDTASENVIILRNMNPLMCN